MTRAELLVRVTTAFPGVPKWQLDRLLSADLPEDERVAVLRSWDDAGAVPGPSGWAVFVGILSECAAVAELVIPIEGAIQGIINIGHG